MTRPLRSSEIRPTICMTGPASVLAAQGLRPAAGRGGSHARAPRPVPRPAHAVVAQPVPRPQLPAPPAGKRSSNVDEEVIRESRGILSRRRPHERSGRPRAPGGEGARVPSGYARHANGGRARMTTWPSSRMKPSSMRVSRGSRRRSPVRRSSTPPSRTTPSRSGAGHPARHESAGRGRLRDHERPRGHATPGSVSAVSPVGEALLGRRRGDRSP